MGFINTQSLFSVDTVSFGTCNRFEAKRKRKCRLHQTIDK